MAVIVWSDKLDIGVPQMNEQHKQLIGIMNRLQLLHESSASRGEVSAELDSLAECTVNHFAAEEAYMESIDYSGLTTHKLIHKTLLTKFVEHKQAFDDGGDLSNAFFVFLKNWLTAHIQGIDKKYGPAGS